jgi:carbamoyl-phosphate synthase large subunit
MISKRIGKGHPNVLDVIRDGTVNVVLNTPTGGRVPLRDGFEIRRAATERRIPCFTSIDTIRAAVDALIAGSQLISVEPLPEYRARHQNQP